jgi:hypothetical protein
MSVVAQLRCDEFQLSLTIPVFNHREAANVPRFNNELLLKGECVSSGFQALASGTIWPDELTEFVKRLADANANFDQSAELEGEGWIHLRCAPNELGHFDVSGYIANADRTLRDDDPRLELRFRGRCDQTDISKFLSNLRATMIDNTGGN